MTQVLTNIGQLATCPQSPDQSDVGIIRNAAIAWAGGRVVWCGPESELPGEFKDAKQTGANGALVVPGLVDCHTHLGFGGWRYDEFVRRLEGETYLDISASGGGIRSTVKATRALSVDDLVNRAAGFARSMMRLGVTTIECKSGYGLESESERRILLAYRQINNSLPVRLVSTLLAAHVVPPEFEHARADYVELIIEDIIPKTAEEGLASFCDVFVEPSAFTPDEARRILLAGQQHGLASKVHAAQFADHGEVELAVDIGAISVDHLENISKGGIEALSAGSTVAVTLPLPSLYLSQPPAPARALIESGTPVAIATDFNPGSAPSYELPLAMHLACIHQKMTPHEVLKGATSFASRAISSTADAGSIAPGMSADFLILDAESIDEWITQYRSDRTIAVYASGQIVHQRAYTSQS